MGILFILTAISPSGTFWNFLYATLMVSVGFGWGFSFTLFPAITGDAYGQINFGICYSYVNLGSLLASVLVPNINGLLVAAGSVNIFPSNLFF